LRVEIAKLNADYFSINKHGSAGQSRMLFESPLPMFGRCGRTAGEVNKGKGSRPFASAFKGCAFGK
jgi:hypothetical protein